MTRSKRDTFKLKVYAAEDSTRDVIRIGRRFDTLREAHQWVRLVQSVDDLLSDKPWISVRKAHGNAVASWADFEEFELVLTESGMCEQIILHELAHLATSPDEPYHGSVFCWNYLDLTLRWRGPSVYLEMRNAIRGTGVFG